MIMLQLLTCEVVCKYVAARRTVRQPKHGGRLHGERHHGDPHTAARWQHADDITDELFVDLETVVGDTGRLVDDEHDVSRTVGAIDCVNKTCRLINRACRCNLIQHL